MHRHGGSQIVTPQESLPSATDRTHGFYAEHVVPRLVNLTCAAKTADPLRRRVCAGLVGSVVEIGFGSGLNVPHYPAAVTTVAAVEPSDVAWKLAAGRVQGTRVHVERSALDAQALSYHDNSFDGAVSTWSLCTIGDPVAALTELRRVLKPGGRFHFVEHGLAPDASLAAATGTAAEEDLRRLSSHSVDDRLAEFDRICCARTRRLLRGRFAKIRRCIFPGCCGVAVIRGVGASPDEREQ